MLKRPQGPPNSPHHQRQQCQLRSLCRDRGVMLPCTSCAGVPTPPSPLQQDGHGPSSTILRCPCLLSLRAPWQHLPFGGQHHNSQPGLRTCITAPYSALALPPLESLTVDKCTGPALRTQKPIHVDLWAGHTARAQRQAPCRPKAACPLSVASVVGLLPLLILPLMALKFWANRLPLFCVKSVT